MEKPWSIFLPLRQRGSVLQFCGRRWPQWVDGPRPLTFRAALLKSNSFFGIYKPRMYLAPGLRHTVVLVPPRPPSFATPRKHGSNLVHGTGHTRRIQAPFVAIYLFICLKNSTFIYCIVCLAWQIFRVNLSYQTNFSPKNGQKNNIFAKRVISDYEQKWFSRFVLLDAVLLDKLFSNKFEN